MQFRGPWRLTGTGGFDLLRQGSPAPFSVSGLFLLPWRMVVVPVQEGRGSGRDKAVSHRSHVNQVP